MFTQEANERLSIPFGVDFKEWKSLVACLLQSDYISAREIARATGLGELTVGSNVQFLKAIGIATPDSTRSMISLSRAGARYARAVVDDDVGVQRRALAECARKAFKPVVRFCELHDDLDFEKLFLQMKFLAGVGDEWGQQMDTADPHRAGIATAIEIIVFAGLIDEGHLPKGGSEAGVARSFSRPT